MAQCSVVCHCYFIKASVPKLSIPLKCKFANIEPFILFSKCTNPLHPLHRITMTYRVQMKTSRNENSVIFIAYNSTKLRNHVVCTSLEYGKK